MKRFNENLGLKEYDLENGSIIENLLEKKDMIIIFGYNFNSGTIRYKIVKDDKMLCRELNIEKGFIVYDKIVDDIKNFLVRSVALSCSFAIFGRELPCK